MNIIFYMSLWLLFLPVCCLQSSVLSTADSAVVVTQLEQADTDSLVVFDIDEVLLRPVDALLQKQNCAYRHHLYQITEQLYGRMRSQQLDSIITQQAQIGVVDPLIPAAVANLHQRAVKVLALTLYPSGQYGYIDALEVHRDQRLQNNGYFFKRSWPDLANALLLPAQGMQLVGLKKSTLPSLPAYTPLFFQGVVYANGQTKGEALRRFLGYANWQPKKIIFIDDSMNNLISVRDFAKSSAIEFVGVEYTQAQQLEKPLDQRCADMQFKTLRQEQYWMSDEKARACLRDNAA